MTSSEEDSEGVSSSPRYTSSLHQKLTKPTFTNPNLNASSSQGVKKNPNKSTNETSSSKKIKEKDVVDVDVADGDATLNECEPLKNEKDNFQRVWSHEEVENLLACMVKYLERKKKHPFHGKTAFYQFYKKSLGKDFSFDQVKSKMRRLKTWYENNLKKVSIEVIDRTKFEMADKLWRDDTKHNIFNSRKCGPFDLDSDSARNACYEELMKRREMFSIVIAEPMARDGIRFMEDDEVTELLEKWNEAVQAEMKAHHLLTEVIRDQVLRSRQLCAKNWAKGKK